MSCGGCGGMITSLAGAVLRVGVAALSGEQVRLPAMEREARLQTCVKCPHFTGATALLGPRCELYGCFLEIKTWMATEGCPDNRWTKIVEEKV